MSQRAHRPNSRVIAIGEYTVSQTGDSKGVNCIKKLENYDFPTDLGDKLQVEFRENGPDGEPEVVLKPAGENHD